MIIKEESIRSVIRLELLKEEKNKQEASKVLQKFLDTGKLDKTGQESLEKVAGRIDIESSIKNGPALVKGIEEIFQSIEILLKKDENMDLVAKLNELAQSVLKMPFEKFLGLITFGNLPFVSNFVKKKLEKMIRRARGKLYLMINHPNTYKLFKQANQRIKTGLDPFFN